MWNFGSLMILVFIIQFLSGLFVSIHYYSNIETSFASVVHISREVSRGWILRLFHINGASLYFVIIFIHIIKNIFNSSWKIKLVWVRGILILILSILVAFIGYVLPWGQISFWAATVITNLISIIPYLGNILILWIWGGYSVSYPTLSRFFSFHFLFPFIIIIFIFLHIFFLHLNGSSNTISSSLNLDKIHFDPYFSVKDLLGVIFLIFFIILVILSFPYYSVDSENFIEANSLVTPVHIKPEWYFLFAYAILRSIPNKIGGVVGLIIRIIVLILKIFQNHRRIKFSISKKFLINIFFFSFIILTILGGKIIEYPYEILSKSFSFIYFIRFLML